PTTNLPGSTAVEDHVNLLLKQKTACALLYLDVEHFEAFADAYGFRKADDLVAELGGLVLERARAYGGSDAFVGHVGGDDFVIVVRPDDAEELAQDLVEAFDARVPRWYQHAEDGPQQTVKRMTLSIAVVVAPQAAAETPPAPPP